MSSANRNIVFIIFSYLILLSATTESVTAQNEQEMRSTLLQSEAPSIRFEQISLNEGMSQASANNIMQDSKGFLWIATQGGLHRYDGREFKIYHQTPFDTTSLSENWVWGMSESSTGDIWLTTEGGGLNRLDQTTGKFIKYLHDPDDSTSISSDRGLMPFEDRNGDLWVGTFGAGLNRMRNGEDGVFTRFEHVHEDSTTISGSLVFWINQDSGGYIWAGTGNGITRIDPETEEMTRFLFEPDGREGYGSPVNVLSQYFPPHQPESVWLATGNGLVHLNSNTGAYERYLIAPNEDGNTNPYNFLHQVVPDPDNPNVLWVGGPGTGISRFDMLSETFTSYRSDPRDPHSLGDNNVQSMYTDRSGTIWVGTASEGLAVFNPGAVNFTHLTHDPENEQSLAPGLVWGVYEDQEGSLWVGTDVGSAGHYLTEFDARSGTTSRYRFDPADSTTILFGSVRAFTEDANGNLWIAGSGGLNLFDRSTKKARRFRHPQLEENRGRNSIFALIPTYADQNMLWVASIGGLDVFNTKTGEFKHVSLPKEELGLEFDPPVISMHQDKKGVLWLGSLAGLLKISPEGETTVVSYYDPADSTTINTNQISSITQRQNEPGILWLAMQNGGLNRFDTQTNTATHFTEADGLPNNTLYGLLVDDNNTLWMSTNGGISNFDPETQTFRNYGQDDGLMALEYNQNAYFKGKGGVLYFGSGKGVTAFVPEQLHINEIPPQVVLEDFRIFNKPVAIGPESPLKEPLDKTKQITLKYQLNEVTFDYVALHFANAQKNTYTYKLEGFDPDWVDAGTKRSATYTNLPAGDYTFKVRAANADGIWNQEGASIGLTILPPWYRTWWAYGLGLGLLGFMVFGVDRIQRSRISKKELERQTLRDAELRAEAENKRRADTEQLSQIGRTITSSLSVDKIIETVYEHVNALMDAAVFGVGIYNEEKNRIDFPATKENGKMLPAFANYLDEDDRLAVYCFKKKEEIIIGNYEKEYKKYVKSYQPPIEGDASLSILYMPLIHQNRVIGVITTQSFSKDAYSAYHVNLIRNLATYAAIALDNASAYRQLNATLHELQNMQQQLVQQEKLASLGQLTAGIAHEIKNPLNFVNNFSELSVELIDEAREEVKRGTANGKRDTKDYHLEGSTSSESLRERRGLSDEATNQSLILDILDDIEANLKTIHKHGTRADGIVKSMLEHSRGGTGKMEPTELNALLKEYVNLSFHGMRAGKNPINVDLKFELDASIKDISLKSEDFSRVIVNLSNNAFDAMRDKLKKYDRSRTKYQPTLTTRSYSKGEHIVVEIEDNGPGIPEALRDKILQPFFTTKKGTEGTGLGLSITNDIVKAHGGTLEIDTKAGILTRFRIIFQNH